MDQKEIANALAQIEQLAVALQIALKHSPAQVRAIMGRGNFGFSRRIALQRMTWVLVGGIRAQLKLFGQKGKF